MSFCICTALTYIGGLYILFQLFRFSRFAYKRFFRKGYDLKERYGDGWAVVTGATDGIGLEYAKQLSQRGFKVILIGRNEEKLKHRIQELKKETGNEDFKYVLFDFDQWYDKDEYDQMFNKINEIGDVALLINNVGILIFKPFELMTHEEIDQMMKVNTTATLHLTRLMIPKLLKRKERSLIVNVGAGFGLLGMPGVAVYGATKALMHNFTQSLQRQYRGKIDILQSIPGPVYSKMNPKDMNIPLSVNTPDHVRGTLNDAGYEDSTHGHLKHDILGVFTGSIITDKIMMKEFKNWEATNQQYEKYKKEIEEKDTFHKKKID